MGFAHREAAGYCDEGAVDNERVLIGYEAINGSVTDANA
jgi:hypothetical protein